LFFLRVLKMVELVFSDYCGKCGEKGCFSKGKVHEENCCGDHEALYNHVFVPSVLNFEEVLREKDEEIFLLREVQKRLLEGK